MADSLRRASRFRMRLPSQGVPSAPSTTCRSSSTWTRPELLAQGGIRTASRSGSTCRTVAHVEIAQSIQATFAKGGGAADHRLGRQAATSKIRSPRIPDHDRPLGAGLPGSPHQCPELRHDVDDGETRRSKTTAWRTAWDIPELSQETRPRCWGRTRPSARQCTGPAAQDPRTDPTPSCPSSSGRSRAQERPGWSGARDGERLLLAGEERSGNTVGFTA